MSDLRLTHIGGPTVLIETEGWRILTDPTFDPPGRTYKFGWGTSSRKLSGPAIAAADLGSIDAVLISHAHHADNLDAAGRSLLGSADRVVTTRAAAGGIAGADGLDPWQSTRLESPGRPSIEITATPCRHGPPLSRPIVGHVIGFSLAWAGQAHGTVWISGDTVFYDGVREVADRIHVGIAVLHLGEVRFPVTGPVRYSMTAHDAVELCGLMQPRVAIPVHYEGWSHFQEGRDVIDREFAAAPAAVRDRFRVVPIGETVDLVA